MQVAASGAAHVWPPAEPSSSASLVPPRPRARDNSHGTHGTHATHVSGAYGGDPPNSGDAPQSGDSSNCLKQHGGSSSGANAERMHAGPYTREQIDTAIADAACAASSKHTAGAAGAAHFEYSAPESSEITEELDTQAVHAQASTSQQETNPRQITSSTISYHQSSGSSQQYTSIVGRTNTTLGSHSGRGGAPLAITSYTSADAGDNVIRRSDMQVSNLHAYATVFETNSVLYREYM